MGAGEGVVKNKDANLLLKENGRSTELTKGWAQSVLSCMRMVLKCKAFSKNKVTPEHFDIVKEQFLLDIKQLVDTARGSCRFPVGTLIVLQLLDSPKYLYTHGTFE